MLLVARLVQGLAHGGELPSSQTYLSEMAPKEHRGFWATLIYTSGTVGILFGTLLGADPEHGAEHRGHERLGLADPVPDRRRDGPVRPDHAGPAARDGRLRGRVRHGEARPDLAADRPPPQAGPAGHRPDRRPHGDLLHLGCGGPQLCHHRAEDRPRRSPVGRRHRQHRVHRRPAVLGQALGPDRPQEGAVGRRHRRPPSCTSP